MRSVKRESGMVVLDRALTLLRRAGTPALSIWAIATVPFLLTFLYFLSAMSSSYNAEQRIPALAAAVATSYAWMKGWQTEFGKHLRTVATHLPPPRIEVRSWLATTAEQLKIQPLGIVLVPLALLVSFPFGWVYAYYQSASVTGDRKRAGSHACDAPIQNHQMLTIYALLWIVLFVNVAISCFVVPNLLKSILGIETVFSQAPRAFINSTTLAVVLAISYFLAGPVIRAAYVVRCLDHDSQTTAEDLLTQLQARRRGDVA